MWRFILISFALLGFVFYEASGGSDYAPAPDSLQVVIADKPIFAPALDMTQQSDVVTASADDLPPIETRSAATGSSEPTEMRGGERGAPVTFARGEGVADEDLGGVDITLASTSQDQTGDQPARLRGLNGMGSFDVETLVADVRGTPIDRAVVSTSSASSQNVQTSSQAAVNAADIRSVTGDLVNMRSGPGTDYDAVDQLARGTDVEVLGRRGAWVELRDIETGQTGWMADWLVTAAN